MSAPAAPLLEVNGLRKWFPVREGIVVPRTVGHVRAVEDVSFSIGRGEVLALVGESGSGKSTTGRLVLRLLEPTAGSVRFDGVDLLGLGAREMRAFRRRMQIVFQDPYSSLNPHLRVADMLEEAMVIHGLEPDGAARRARVEELLATVGLRPEYGRRFPHEFSGGQRQRLAIARALAVRPEFIVADEPVSALDVSIQAQIVNLFQDLQQSLGLTYVFVAHDLAVVRHISDRIAVMYLGRIVEIADRETLYKRPQHPYTQALLAAVPIPDPEIEATRPQIAVTGEVPSALRPPPGCRFHTRCPRATDVCKTQEPVLRDLGGGQMVSCHHV